MTTALQCAANLYDPAKRRSLSRGRSLTLEGRTVTNEAFGSTDSRPMIDVNRLKMAYGSFVAVDSISFKLQKGDVLALLGPNGAGKSTTMKMLTCFLPPTEGTAQVCGNDIRTHSEKVKSLIGFMPENAPLYGDMNVYEFLHFAAKMRSIAKADIEAAIQRAIELCHLQQVVYRSIDHLSKGYRARASMAQALIHDPPVLILDEPTDGLDPNQKDEVRKLIKKLSPGKCIILSTHLMEEIGPVCNRAIIIARGKVKFDGVPQELIDQSRDGNLNEVFRKLTIG